MHAIFEEKRSVPVKGSADMVVVGGGSAGFAAAIAAARQGLSVILVERYAYLGGLASGGMVLVLDDMAHESEISVRGLTTELIERMEKIVLCVVPPESERNNAPETIRKWMRWGFNYPFSKQRPRPVCYSAAFDPDAWKRVCNEMLLEEKDRIDLRLHTWFAEAYVENGAIKGVICESKEGRHALLGKIVVDASGDLDVGASAGAAFEHGQYMVSTVFRLGGVDTEAAIRFELEEPEKFRVVDQEAKRILGGSWDTWWLKTVLPGVVWCNCPHMHGYDGLSVRDLTRGELDGRARVQAVYNYARDNIPGFEKSYIVDVAPQFGVRQTRLLDGQYRVTKQDIAQCVQYPDSIARGRDFYYPYRALLPREVDGLIVAGRHFSATSDAQRTSREIPCCVAMGEAAGIAAAMALEANVSLSDIDVGELQRRLIAVGADPGAPAAASNEAVPA